MRQDGYWINRAADVLPLALANWSRQLVRIYSSDPQKPIIEVHPTSKCQSEVVILLAYTVSSGSGVHYDACTQIVPAEVASPDTIQPEQIPVESDLNNRSHCVPASPTRETAGNSPRKAASFMTPPKRKRNRKKKATQENLKKNIRKNLRLTGQEYVNQKGKTEKEKR